MFKHYGILSLPIAIMMPLGLLGSRNGQVIKGCICYLINFLVILNYGILPFISFGFFSNTATLLHFSNVYLAYAVFKFTILIIFFTLLIFKFYKKYNVVCLLDDISKTRFKGLENRDIIQILMYLLLIVSIFIYHVRYYLHVLL